MKQTEEKWKKNKKSLFDNHGPLCFVHLFVTSSGLQTFSSCRHRRHFLYTSSGDGGERKQWSGVQNCVWQSTEAHHIHLYRYAHSSLCVSLYSTHNVFSFVHPSVVYTRLISTTYLILQNRTRHRLTSAQYRVQIHFLEISTNLIRSPT